jgi:hypothetical protein
MNTYERSASHDKVNRMENNLKFITSFKPPLKKFHFNTHLLQFYETYTGSMLITLMKIHETNKKKRKELKK